MVTLSLQFYELEHSGCQMYFWWCPAEGSKCSQSDAMCVQFPYICEGAGSSLNKQDVLLCLNIMFSFSFYIDQYLFSCLFCEVNHCGKSSKETTAILLVGFHLTPLWSSKPLCIAGVKMCSVQYVCGCMCAIGLQPAEPFCNCGQRDLRQSRVVLSTTGRVGQGKLRCGTGWHPPLQHPP